MPGDEEIHRDRRVVTKQRPPDLVSAAHLNFLGSFRKLAEHAPGGEVRAFGTAFAFVTGLPAPLFNGCVLVEEVAPGMVDDALTWVAGRRLPFRVFVGGEPATALDEVFTAHSLRRDAEPYPAMVLHPLPEPPPRPAGIEVVDGLEPGLAPYLPESFLDDAEVRVFSALVDDQPAGVSIAIRTGDVSGVYGVATRPAFRRRGVGTAVSWAAVDAGREWGCDTVVLQASAEGLPVYALMGFRTVVEYVTFTRLAD
jgi:GNAT superfamily N-acetyltransferase